MSPSNQTPWPTPTSKTCPKCGELYNLDFAVFTTGNMFLPHTCPEGIEHGRGGPSGPTQKEWNEGLNTIRTKKQLEQENHKLKQELKMLDEELIPDIERAAALKIEKMFCLALISNVGVDNIKNVITTFLDLRDGVTKMPFGWD